MAGDMDQLFDFIANHPLLVGTFVLLLVLFVRNETRRGGDSVSAQQLVDLVNRENAVVIDVRDKKEFEQGHIVGAVNVPYAALEGRVGELKKYQDKPVVIACRMGQHAGAAGMILKKNGFASVTRLAGGIAEWRNQNLPVVKG
jgi:rhodanese-related sulfurtransferase